MSKKRKPIPVFRIEAEERAFCESHDFKRKQSVPAKGVHCEHTRRQFGKDY